MVAVKLVIIPGGWILIYSAMKLVFMGPEAFNFRKCVKTSGLNPAGLQGEMQSSLLCLDRQAAICTAGQMFMVLKKGSISGKVDPSCWEVYRWLCYCTKLIFPSVGCNRITRGSDQAEAGPKRRLWASRERESSTTSSAGQNQMLVSVPLCVVSSVHQPSDRQKNRKKKGMANRVPEDKQEGDRNFRTKNWALVTETEEILHHVQGPARALVAWSWGALKIFCSLFWASHSWGIDSVRACLGNLDCFVLTGLYEGSFARQWKLTGLPMHSWPKQRKKFNIVESLEGLGWEEPYRPPHSKLPAMGVFY